MQPVILYRFSYDPESSALSESQTPDPEDIRVYREESQHQLPCHAQAEPRNGGTSKIEHRFLALIFSMSWVVELMTFRSTDVIQHSEQTNSTFTPNQYGWNMGEIWVSDKAEKS